VAGPSAPITRYMRRIASALRRAAGSEATHVTLQGLVEMMGAKAHRLLLLVVSLFNMIPGPPGYGGTIACATCLIAFAMLMGRPIRLPGIIGNRRLNLDMLVRASDQVTKVAGILARVSRPRQRWLTSAAANVPYAVFVMVVSLVMVLPIPFINAVPNVGLCIIAFSMLNRDGVGVVIGVIATLLGLVVAGAILFGAFHLGMAAIDAVA